MDDQLIEKYADVFKALSNKNRLTIYLTLVDSIKDGESYKCEYDKGESSSCQLDMAKKLGIATSTLSHHLKELKNAGLITVRREGRTVSMEIDSSCRALLKKFVK